MTNKKSKDKPVPKFMHLGKTGLEPTKRFQAGDFYALKRKPRSLLNPDSIYRKILHILADHRNGGLTNTQIVHFYNLRNKPIKSASNRLSELFAYGLVEHEDINLSGGVWSIKNGTPVSNGETLYALAVRNQEKLSHAGTAIARSGN